jgi:hypothetical protein
MNNGLEASRRRARRNVVLAAAIAGLGGLLFATTPGVIAGALLFIKGDFDLGCVPALALGFGMLRMPRWLVMSGDDFAARATLARIRVDDPGDLPAQRVQQGGWVGDDGQLDLQLHRLAHLPLLTT